MKKIKSNINSPTDTSQADQSQIDYSAIISIKKPEIKYLESSNSSQNNTNMDCDQIVPKSSQAALQVEPENSQTDPIRQSTAHPHHQYGLTQSQILTKKTSSN